MSEDQSRAFLLLPDRTIGDYFMFMAFLQPSEDEGDRVVVDMANAAATLHMNDAELGAVYDGLLTAALLLELDDSVYEALLRAGASPCAQNIEQVLAFTRAIRRDMSRVLFSESEITRLFGCANAMGTLSDCGCRVPLADLQPAAPCASCALPAEVCQ